MRTKDFQDVKIYRIPPEAKRTRKDGTPRDPKRLGKVHFPVFTADGRSVVGFMVSPPDVAGMIKQPDRFVARDAVRVYEGVIAVDDAKGSYDAAAAKRLGIDLDTCIIWTGMDVVTVQGTKLGYCSDAAFNPKTGAVTSFTLTGGAAAAALLGTIEMPVRYLKGYRDGAMIVDDEAATLELSGGAAANGVCASSKAVNEVYKKFNEENTTNSGQNIQSITSSVDNYTDIKSIDISPGVYVAIARIEFQSLSATGDRKGRLAFSTSSGTFELATECVRAASNNWARLSVCDIFKTNVSGSIKVQASQSSGSAIDTFGCVTFVRLKTL